VCCVVAVFQEPRRQCCQVMRMQADLVANG
jgi:hypothetical protein